EAGELGQTEAFVIAQPYRVDEEANEVEDLGEPQVVGTTELALSDSQTPPSLAGSALGTRQEQSGRSKGGHSKGDSTSADSSRMQLILASGRTIQNVKRKHLELIDGEEYATLVREDHPEVFIQCMEMNDSPQEYILEYRDGSADKHFRATDEAI